MRLDFCSLPDKNLLLTSAAFIFKGQLSTEFFEAVIRIVKLMYALGTLCELLAIKKDNASF